MSTIQTDANQLQASIDVVYSQITKLSGGALTVSNVMQIITTIINQAATLNIPAGSTKQVILTALNQFCVEHATDSVVLTIAEPFVDFALQVSTGAISLKPEEAAVKSCCS